MSDKKISQFNELTTATNADLIPIVDVATNETKFITKENLIPNASFIENIVVKTQADATLELDKINWVTLINDHTISAPTPDASNLGKIIIVNNRSSSYSLTITGLVVMPVILNGYNSIIGIVCVTDGVDYGWEVFSRYNLADFDLISQTITNGVTDKSPSEDAVFDALALKLDLSGANANQDIDIDGFGVNAKHFKVNGTGGAGHIGLKHQSANISASASESSIGADIVGDPVWKNDGGAIDKLELQSNKTSTVTGNEASTTKYLTVKGVYDWAVGLFAPKASPTFTGTITTPDIVVSGATVNTIAHFDGTKNIESLPLATYPSLTELSYVKGVTSAIQTQINAKLSGAYLSLTDSSTTVTNTNPIQPVQIGLFTTADPNRGFLMFQNGLGNQLLRPYEGEFWANKGDGGYLALWDGRRIASAANGGNSSLSTSIAKYADSNGSQKIEVNIFSINNGPYYHINAILTVDGSGNVSNINIKQPSSNPTAFNVTINAGKAQIVGNNYTLLFYASYRRLTYGGLGNAMVLGIESEKYSTTGLAKYWTGSEGFGVGHTSQNASAILQADSTSKGFLPPRMTNVQRTSIAGGTPPVGLIVYCTDATEGLYIYKSTGWIQII